jgi:hypothetical protein
LFGVRSLEVLFGWSSNSAHYLGDDVFLSKNELVAKSFLNYFHRLAQLGSRMSSRPMPQAKIS